VSRWARALAGLRRRPADEAAVRKRFFKAARPLTRYLSVEAKGLTFLVATDDRLGRGLFVRRWRQDFRHLERAVGFLEEHGLSPAGSTLVDVGANIGTTTVRAIRRHGFARAVALEPEPGNFRVLRLNVVANEIDSRVTALQVAGSDHVGDVELALSRRSSGEHALARLRPDGDAARTLTVPAVTLDDLVDRGVIEPDAVGLLWIDAAGAEALVLAGASRLLERGVPVVAALRPGLPDWPQTKASLSRLLAGYTDFADLRHGRPPGAALEPLLDSLSGNGDLLAFRR
jgi:FkbM family methyltransferase